MTAAVVAAALAGCGTRPASGRLLSSFPSKLAPAPRPPAGVARLRLVGASGATAWELATTGLRVTQDAGRHWSSVLLPAGVLPSLVTTVIAATGRGRWLAVWQSPVIDLYHEDPGASTWYRRTLAPQLPPPDSLLAGLTPTVSITLGSARVVTVVAEWGITSTQAYSTMFISADNGAAFSQHPIGIGMNVSSAMFVSAQEGVIVAGPAMNLLYRTSDGGASWSPVRIPGLPASAPGIVSYGPPVADGAQLLLPVMVTGVGGAQSLWIYPVADGGAAARGPTGPPLHVPAAVSAGQVTPAMAGSIIWLPARGRIYESTDAGGAWTAVTTAESPFPISVISRSLAIGVATDSGCRSFKSGCYYYTYLVITTDGGHNWQTLYNGSGR